MEYLYDPTFIFLVWALLVVPFFARARGLTALQAFLIVCLSGVFVSVSPNFFSAAHANSTFSVWYRVLGVFVIALAAFLGKKVREKQGAHG
jgi:hypothetical protein